MNGFKKALLGLLAVGATALTVYAIETGPADTVLRVPAAGGRAQMGAVDISKAAAVTGVLRPVNGGTGTAASFTQGSVIHVDGSGNLVEDNAGLFFDSATNELGVNTAIPEETIEADGNIALTGTGKFIRANNNDTIEGQIVIRDSGPGNLQLRPASVSSIQQDVEIPVGRLGIGAAAPEESLEVAGSIALFGTNKVIRANNNDTTESAITLRDGATGDIVLTPSLVGSTQSDLVITAGNLGVGTVTPTSKIQMVDTAGAGVGTLLFDASITQPYTGHLKLTDTGMEVGHDNNTRNLQLLTDNTARLTVGATGGVTIATFLGLNSGIGSSGIPLFVDDAPRILFRNNDAVGDDILLDAISGTSGMSSLRLGDSTFEGAGRIDYNNADNSMRFFTDTTEVLTLQGNNAVGINDSTPAAAAFNVTALTAGGIVSTFINDFSVATGRIFDLAYTVDTDVSGLLMIQAADGDNLLASLTVTNATTATWTDGSDARLKDNIRPLSPELAREKMNSLKIRQWEWKADGVYSFGLVAQETMQSNPGDGIAFGDPYGDERLERMSVDIKKLPPINMVVNQDQETRIVMLESIIAMLCSRPEFDCGSLLNPAPPILVEVEVDDLAKPIVNELADSRITLDLDGMTPFHRTREYQNELRQEGTHPGGKIRYKKNLLAGSVDVWFVTPIGFEKKTVMREDN